MDEDSFYTYFSSGTISDDMRRTTVDNILIKVENFQCIHDSKCIEKGNNRFQDGIFNKSISLPDGEKIEDLEIHCPGSTAVERYRLFLAKTFHYISGLKQLQSYMKWRQDIDLDMTESNTGGDISDEDWHSCDFSFMGEDEYDWNTAAAAAISANLDNNDRNEIVETLSRLTPFDDANGNNRCWSRMVTESFSCFRE